jgi:hypothetical protein
LDIIPELYKATSTQIKDLIENLPDTIYDFLMNNEFEEKLVEINSNSASLPAFKKRLYSWFDGFVVVKYLNSSHLKKFNKLPVTEAIMDLLLIAGYEISSKGPIDLLKIMRNLDLEINSIPQQ